MLALVLAYRHGICLVDENVCGLEDRVGEEANRRAVGAALLRLVLELGHPTRLTEPGLAFKHPGELAVLGHMALDEDRASLRIQPDGEQLRE